ncbi:MAG: SH3 domain-containing protein [Muribaculum sp.]|nr:SH3 domain-containing protein [Muribaculum sp.]
MKKSDKIHNRLRMAAGMLLLSVALTAALFADECMIVSRADSTGKVTAASVNIRKEASTSSEAVGTAERNTVCTVKGQETGSDGYTWYQVSVNGVTGYIRSDLMTVTDGGTSASGASSSQTSSTPTTSTPDEPLVAVTAVEPVSASVKGGSDVRVRQNASTTSRIITTARSGLALTVTGKADGTDGNEWYQVHYISGGSDVNGFIRKDYVEVSGELVPVDTSAEQPGNEPPTAAEPEPEEVKDWDTYYEGGKWHLLNNGNGNSYDIDQIFSSVEENNKTLQDTLEKNRTQQIIVILLVILLIFMAAAISFLIFKLKDMSDSAYFNEVERETVRRRTADRPVERTQGGQRVMQTVGGESRRPAGQRPAGGANHQRPTGQRPTGGANPQRQTVQRPTGGADGQRPAGGANPQRQTGQRPTGGADGQRPAGGANPQRQTVQRPTGGADGQRPAGGANPQRQTVQRPTGGADGQRPAGGANPQRQTGQRPEGGANAQRPVNRQPERQETSYQQEYETAYEQEPQVREKAPERPAKSGWKAKNFINDDEFEFQFLDWEDDQK